MHSRIDDYSRANIQFVTQLTISAVPLIVEIYMLGRFKSSFTFTGSHRHNEFMILSSTVGGAEAVRAMKGTFVRARKPPILSNALRNWGPLYTRSNTNLSYIRKCTGHLLSPYHSWIRCASSTSTRCCWKYGDSNMLLQDWSTAVSGDMNTEIRKNHWISQHRIFK